MRVISGKYRGKRFSPPRKFSSRPTTDRAKEALFSILDSRMYFENLDVLDIFSGTGNISLEFLSRGVGKVISVDNHAVAHKFQQKTAEELNDPNWHCIQQNALTYLENCQQKFDVIFADPPYEFKELEKIPELVFSNSLLVEDGILILEHSDRISMTGAPYLKNTRNYGGVCFSFFEY